MEKHLNVEVVAGKILVVRGKKVILDRDLVDMYGMAVKGLNKQAMSFRKKGR